MAATSICKSGIFNGSASKAAIRKQRTWQQRRKSASKATLVLVSCFLLPSCGDYSSVEDRKFVAKIKQHIKKKEDSVRVSDIHPGDWIKVCFTIDAGVGGEGYDMAAWVLGLHADEIQVVNRPRDETNFLEGFGWGIYFIYPPNKIEYFRIDKVQMAQGAVISPNRYDCAEKERAFFTTGTDGRRWANGDLQILLSIDEREDQ